MLDAALQRRTVRLQVWAEHISGYCGTASQFKQKKGFCTMGISQTVVYGTLGEKHLSPGATYYEFMDFMFLVQKNNFPSASRCSGRGSLHPFCEKLNLLLCDAKESRKK
jgi:hypothetical protein